MGKRGNLHIGLIATVIPLKLFLDLVPSSCAAKCFHSRCVNVFVLDENACKASWLVHLSKVAFFWTFSGFPKPVII